MRNWAGNVRLRRQARSTVPAPSPSCARWSPAAAGSGRWVAATRSTGSPTPPGTWSPWPGCPRSSRSTARPRQVDGVGRRCATASWPAACTPQGCALHNLASLPHISVAGAVRHRHPRLRGRQRATWPRAVAGLELVTADGELRHAATGDTAETFAGTVVGLGALGVVTRAHARRRAGLRRCASTSTTTSPRPTVLAHLDEILAAAYSVSLFTDWQPGPVDQVWRKRRVGAADGRRTAPAPTGCGATAADRAPAPGARDAGGQLHRAARRAGPWHERLPHFRMEFTPSSGEELQSEYLVPAARGPAGARARSRRSGTDRAGAAGVRDAHGRRRRAVAEPELPARQPGAALHLGRRTPRRCCRWWPRWRSGWRRCRRRPHWGKLFVTEPAAVAGVYERYADFRRLRALRDPDRKFSNDFLDRYFPSP